MCRIQKAVKEMSATIELLERLKAANDGASDYRAAKILDIKPATISKWRHRGSQMDDPIALRIAGMLGLSPLQVLAKIHAEKAKDEELKKFWASVSQEAETPQKH